MTQAVVVLVAAMIALVAACNNGGQPASNPSGTGTIGQVDPTSSGSPTPPCCGPPSPTSTLILATPQAAAEHLYNSWKANDAASASVGATSSAVTALFAKAWKADTYFFGGCTQPTAPSECDYNWSGGIIAMMITGDPVAGFQVSSVSFGNAG
jgi:hypothetical protein